MFSHWKMLGAPACRKILWVLFLAALVLTGCAAPPSGRAEVYPSSSPAVHITVFPSLTSSPTQTVPPPTSTPVLAYTRTTLNVRSGPGTGYSSLGLLPANQKVQVLGQDGSGAWYLILYPTAESGQGWVAATYIQIEEGISLPVAISPTPTPSGPVGRVTQRLNVRSGPGLSFDSLGTLEAETTVNLTGRNQNSTWLQILYPPGPGGHGWVSASYVRVEDVSGLPILDEFGMPIPSTTAGPTSRPMTPTPTIGPAHADGDSAGNPSVRVIFSLTGARQFVYSDDLSSPEGDAEDWIEFTPYALLGSRARVTLLLTCEGNGLLVAEFLQGEELQNTKSLLACNQPPLTLDLTGGIPYLLRLRLQPSASLQYVFYTLSVKNDF